MSPCLPRPPAGVCSCWGSCPHPASGSARRHPAPWPPVTYSKHTHQAGVMRAIVIACRQGVSPCTTSLTSCCACVWHRDAAICSLPAPSLAPWLQGITHAWSAHTPCTVSPMQLPPALTSAPSHMLWHPPYLFQLLGKQQAGATPRGIKVDDCGLLYRAAHDDLQLLLIHLADVAEGCCCTDLFRRKEAGRAPHQAAAALHEHA